MGPTTTPTATGPTTPTVTTPTATGPMATTPTTTPTVTTPTATTPTTPTTTPTATGPMATTPTVTGPMVTGHHQRRHRTVWPSPPRHSRDACGPVLARRGRLRVSGQVANVRRPRTAEFHRDRPTSWALGKGDPASQVRVCGVWVCHRSAESL